MELDNIIIMDCEERMDKSIASFSESLSKVKTGRASASLVRDVEIDYWGSPTPLYQVSNISTPDASQILIKPYDKNQLKAIEKAIINADLGFTPLNDGTVIRCNVPQLTGETRAKLVKECYKMAEDAKVAVRNIRREANDSFKKLAKEEVSEDEIKDLENEIQKLTDKYIKDIEKAVEEKSKEILTV